MLDSVSIEDRKQEMKKMIDEEIDKRVLEKINALQNAHTPNIDAAKIEKECRDELIKEVIRQVKEDEKKIPEFFQQLQLDNPKLYEVLKLRADQSMANSVEKFKITLDKDELEKLLSLGRKWFVEDDYNKAFLYFCFITLADPKNADAWLKRGMAEHNLQKYDNAMQSYASSLMIDPRSLLTYINLMNSLILANRIEEAKQIYDDLAPDLDPSFFTNGSDIANKLVVVKQYVTGELVII